MVNKHEQTNPQTEENFSKSEAFFCAIKRKSCSIFKAAM